MNMENNNEETNNAAENVETIIAVEPAEDNNNLLRIVSNKIKDSGQRVKDIVVEKLVEVEIGLRVDLITKVIKAYDVMERNFRNKINRPDIKQYDSDRNETVAFSEARIKEIDKTKENLTKFKTAIDNALNLNTEESYKKLKEVYDKIGGNQNDKSGNDKAGS